jgi:uncharacterized damage-inducible protein DinB
VWGKGRQPLSPPQHTVAPEREERSGLKSNFQLADNPRRTVATGRHRMVHMDYISERRREMQTTLRVLQAYPESKIDLKPAEKSRTAAELVMMLAVEERVLQALMQTGSTDPTLLNFEAPSSMAEIISIWQQAVAANDEALAVMSPGDFERPIDFYGMHISLGQALWYELFDHIHHRGQISVYMRMAGAKLPSIYGPTADEPMSAGA